MSALKELNVILYRTPRTVFVEGVEYRLNGPQDVVILQALVDAYPLPARYRDIPISYVKYSPGRPPRGSLMTQMSKLKDTLRDKGIPLEVYAVHHYGYLLVVPRP